MIFELTQDPMRVRSLIQEWLAKSSVRDFGFRCTSEDVIADLANWLRESSGTLILAVEDKQTIGFIAVFLFPNYLNDSAVLAIEKYWYATPNTIIAGPRLLEEAMVWSRRRGATHFVVSGSKMMPESCEGISRFAELMAFQPFETSYITRL